MLASMPASMSNAPVNEKDLSSQQLGPQNQRQQLLDRPQWQPLSHSNFQPLGHEFNQPVVASSRPEFHGNTFMNQCHQNSSVAGNSNVHTQLEGYSDHIQDSELNSDGQQDIATTTSTASSTNLEKESCFHVQKIQFATPPNHTITDVDANTPPPDPDPNTASISNRNPPSECMVDSRPVPSNGDVFIQTTFETAAPSSSTAAPPLSPTNQFVTQSSSVLATPDVDLGNAPALSTFLSGSDAGGGHDQSPHFIRIASTDSGIEKTFGISMNTPLPVATLRKLLSCSSDTAEQQNEDSVN